MVNEQKYNTYLLPYIKLQSILSYVRNSETQSTKIGIMLEELQDLVNNIKIVN